MCAFFGEVYPDPVSVVSMRGATSVEFCVGTHLDSTAEAEAFVLVEETAVVKDIRRVTAVTKDTNKQALAKGEHFQTVVLDAERMDAETTHDLDEQAGAIRKDLDAAFLSASLKAELHARIERIQKKRLSSRKRYSKNKLIFVSTK